MELKWLEDLAALAETGSLTSAARVRNISQPAFSRRIRVIEEWLGAPVLLRNTKPARVSPAISRHIEDIKSMTRDLRRLKNDVQGFELAQRRLAVATQHTLSITYFPKVISDLQSISPKVTIELRSGNRDETFSMLMTGQASMLVAYEVKDFPLTPDQSLLEKKLLFKEMIIPVVAKSRAAELVGRKQTYANLSIIGYPDGVFFSQILSAHVFPRLLEQGIILSKVCETALVPAVLKMAASGIGVAWLPRSIVKELDQKEALADISNQLPSYEIEVVASRLKTPRTAFAELVWQKLL